MVLRNSLDRIDSRRPVPCDKRLLPGRLYSFRGKRQRRIRVSGIGRFGNRRVRKKSRASARPETLARYLLAAFPKRGARRCCADAGTIGHAALHVVHDVVKRFPTRRLGAYNGQNFGNPTVTRRKTGLRRNGAKEALKTSLVVDKRSACLCKRCSREHEIGHGGGGGERVVDDDDVARQSEQGPGDCRIAIPVQIGLQHDNGFRVVALGCIQRGSQIPPAKQRAAEAVALGK